MPDLVTGDAVVLDVQIVQLPARALAKLIDAVLQAVLYAIVLFMFCASMLSLTVYGVDDAWLIAIVIFLTAAVLVGYPVMWESMSRGRTLGKLIMGLRVVAEDGGPIRFRQALVRGFTALFEVFLLGAAPAVICSLASAKGKRIGDLFAGTVVINERTTRVPPPQQMPWGLAPWAAGLSLAGLTPELAQLAGQYVRRAAQLTPQVRDALLRRVAGEIAGVISPPPPADMHPMTLIVTVLAERHRREWQRYAKDAARRDALRQRREALFTASHHP